MNTKKYAAFLIGLSLILFTACGGGGGGSSAPAGSSDDSSTSNTNTTINGQAILGSLSGAKIYAYKLNDLNTPIGIATADTSEKDIQKAGTFKLNIPDNITNDEYIVVKAVGGLDIDADDDGDPDTTPTKNLGSVYAIAQVKDWKNGVNITPVSDILFSELYTNEQTSNMNNSEISNKLNTLTKKWLDTKELMSYKSVINFNPRLDKIKLKLDWKIIKNLYIQSIHQGKGLSRKSSMVRELESMFDDTISDSDDINEKFSNLFKWTIINKDDHLGSARIENGMLKLYRNGAGGNGGSVGISTATNIDVTDKTNLSFDVIVLSRTVGNGCGWTCEEYPAEIQLELENSNGKTEILRYAVNYGGAEQNKSKSNLTSSLYGSYDFKQIAIDIPQNKLSHLNFYIKQAFPDAVKIRNIYPFASGWNFESYIDNIKITSGNVDNTISNSVIKLSGNTIEKITETNNSLTYNNITNDIFYKTELTKVKSDKVAGKSTIDVNGQKSVIYFPVSNPDLLNTDAKDLLSQENIKMSVTKKDGKVIVDIPKDLMSSWQASDAIVMIDGEPIKVEVLQDDPVIGFYFNDDNGNYFNTSNGIYSKSFVRPFNYNNLSKTLDMPFFRIKDRLSSEKSILSSTDIWNELLSQPITLKYQVLYYENNDGKDEGKHISVRANMKELDLFSDDYGYAKYNDFDVHIPQKYKHIYYIVGPENYIAIDADSNRIIATSMENLLNKNFKDILYAKSNSSKIFNELGYFSWIYNVDIFDKIGGSDGEFAPSIQVTTDKEETTYDVGNIHSWFYRDAKKIKYEIPTIRLTSDFKSYTEGDPINISWEAQNWFNSNVYISMQCNNGKFYLLDTVKNKNNVKNNYKWYSDLSEVILGYKRVVSVQKRQSSRKYSSIITSQNNIPSSTLGDPNELYKDFKPVHACKVQVAGTKLGYFNDQSELFAIYEKSNTSTNNNNSTNTAAKPTSLTIEGPTTVNDLSSTTYTAKLHYDDGTVSTVKGKWSITFPKSTSVGTINSMGVLTTKDFNTNFPIQISVSYSYTEDSSIKTLSNALTVMVKNINSENSNTSNTSVKVTSFTIEGPTTVNENSSATYTAKLHYDDGTVSTVKAKWSIDSTPYATIDSNGKLTTKDISSDQTVRIHAVYGFGEDPEVASEVVLDDLFVNIKDTSQERSNLPEILGIDVHNITSTSVEVYTKIDFNDHGTSSIGGQLIITLTNPANSDFSDMQIKEVDFASGVQIDDALVFFKGLKPSTKYMLQIDPINSNPEDNVNVSQFRYFTTKSE